MSKQSVFLLGPGFIGGEVLNLLVECKKYDVTTLIRRDSAAAAFHQRGVRTVVGTLDDESIIRQHVSASDIVIHTANADHLPSVRAILGGIQQRAEYNQSTIYIHTSGAGILSDDSKGAFKTDKIFDDETPNSIDALPDEAPHRQVDLTITRQDVGGRAKIAIVMPPLIYGVSMPHKRLSIQLPTLVRYALENGYAGQIGEGRSVWNQIHVKDLARGYITLLHWLEQAPVEDVLSNPYWFCENGQELSWNDCVSEIGQALYQAGRIEDPTPRSIPADKFKDLYGEHTPIALGSNSRSRANRLRKLGWEAKEKLTLASLVQDEISLILEQNVPREA
ncbi:hypothetical protein CNMCM8980_005234 [Aspergillus fumigatiaffinis]|nr:hypothetical protein CNMCM8980_005234 [Aspergillus fumigatiaffinis]